MPSTSWANPARASPRNRYEIRKITRCGSPRRWTGCTSRIFLAGQSYGAWLALNFAIATPDRVQKLVLLSPGGGFIPMVRQFSLRGMLMVFFPTRLTVTSFMRWLGITNRPGETDASPVLELT